LHAVAQQTPSAQTPDWHSAPLVHAAPLPSGSVHAPWLHTKPAAQSAAVAHVVKQAPPLHAYGAQSVPPEASPHVPDPSQICAFTTVPWQTVAPQLVPAAHSSHAPAPLQAPSVPQVDAACCAHSLSGSVPAAIGPHTPFAPPPFFAVLHAWQSPVHALLQHTPSAQKPLAQSDPTEHGPPSPAGTTHAPWLHV
jgi:hypothetical protein